MTQQTKGGPAFPFIDSASPREYPGMSLRDYFAAKAMTSELVGGVHIDDFDSVARRAYAMADEMLKERES